MLHPDPDWNAPAHLTGLPYTNWKKRTGYELRGTLAECAERFLNLPYHHQINCSLSWEGADRHMDAAAIARLIERKGVPPQMAARMNIAAQHLMQMLQKPAEEFVPRRGPFNDAAPIGRGYSDK